MGHLGDTSGPSRIRLTRLDAKGRPVGEPIELEARLIGIDWNIDLIHDEVIELQGLRELESELGIGDRLGSGSRPEGGELSEEGMRKGESGN